MKKVLVAVALFASMVMVSCGAPTADSIVDKINSCTTLEELVEVCQDKDLKEAYDKMTPEDQEKIDNAESQKGKELAEKAGKAVGDAMKGALNALGN